MEDKEFDKYIKNQLSDLQSDQPVDWDSMHDRLIDEDIIHEDSLFDDAIKQKVDRVSTPYNTSHWHILREKLLTEAYVKKRLYIAKTIELAVLILFMWSALQVVPVKQETYAIHKYRPEIHTLAQLWDASMQQIAGLFSISDGKQRSLAHQMTYVDTDGLLSSNETDSLRSDISTEKRTATEIASELLNISALPTDMEPLLTAKRLPSVSTTPYISIPHGHDHVSSFIGISGGISANVVETPFTETNGQKGLSLTDTDYQVEVSYGVKHKHVELFTGVGMSKTNYAPTVSTGVFESFRGERIPMSKLEDISYTYLSVPLGLRYHFIDRPTWSAYGLASVGINALVHADYHMRPLSPSELKLVASAPESFGENNLRADLDSNLSMGLFQGTSLLNTIHTSATIGLGLSKQLNQSIALYVQPSYTRGFSFDGVGALEEKIDNYRFDIGVKVTL